LLNRCFVLQEKFGNQVAAQIEAVMVLVRQMDGQTISDLLLPARKLRSRRSASTRASCCSLDFASVGAILVSGMFALHVVEQCAKAHQLGVEVPPMAIPGVGSDLALRTTAERGEDLVIGRSIQCCPHVDRGENDERSS
jgi:hypothetical protein